MKKRIKAGDIISYVPIFEEREEVGRDWKVLVRCIGSVLLLVATMLVWAVFIKII